MKNIYWLAAAAVLVVVGARLPRRSHNAFFLAAAEKETLRDGVKGEAPDENAAQDPDPTELQAMVTQVIGLGLGHPQFVVSFAHDFRRFSEDRKAQYGALVDQGKAGGFPCAGCREDSRYVAVIGPVADVRLTNLLFENDGKTRKVRIEPFHVDSAGVAARTVEVDAKEITDKDDGFNLNPQFETESGQGRFLSDKLTEYLWEQVHPRQPRSSSVVENINSGEKAINR